MTDKMTEVHRMMCEEIQAAAETKLKRLLSQAEKQGVWNISSLMTLEVIERKFNQSATSAEDVAKELTYFSTREAEQYEL